MAKEKSKSGWPKIRKFFNDIHLWLGLSSGIIIILVCFSGTVYVYNTELTEMASPHLYKVTVPANVERISPDALIKKVEADADGKVVSVKIPAELNRTYTFSVKKEGDKSRFGTSYMVNPYTGEITGNSKEASSMKDFMSTMFSLHRWLLLDKVEEPIITGLENKKLGSMITGWATIIFTLGCITGLIIWFPQKVRHWKQGLKIRAGAGWKRTNHDLHNTLAFYSLIFLLVMGLTGPQWSFTWYRTGLQKTLGTYKPEQVNRGNQGAELREKSRGTGNELRGGENSEGPNKSSAKESDNLVETQAGADSIPVRIQTKFLFAGFIKAANEALVYPGDITVTVPADKQSPVAVSKNKIGFFAPAAADRVFLDQQTAAVTKTEIFSDKPFNERVAGSIKALHVGNIYGSFTKILYFIACLIATSLPVTGTLIWWNKLKKKRRNIKKNRSTKAFPQSSVTDNEVATHP